VGRLGAMNTAVGPVQDPASPAHRVPPRPKRQLVLHPILFGAFPVLYLFAQNVHEGLGWSDVLAPLLVCVAAATIVMAVCWLALRDARRAGLITSAFVVLFFSYGHVYQALGGRRVAGFVVGRQALLLPLWAILAAAAVVLAVRLGGRSAALTFGLNLIAAGLVMVNLVQIVVAQAAAPGEVHPAGFDAARPAWHPLPGVTKPPDIYYIVLDEYAGPTTLQDQFGFDDGPFLRALSLRGFDVEPDAHTNYPRTSLSLASTLNMTYLDFLTRRFGAGTGDARPLLDLIRNCEAVRLLKRAGYSYVHIGANWLPTSRSPQADAEVRFGGLSEFSTVLYHSTLLEPVARRLHLLPKLLDDRRSEWSAVRAQFDDLASGRSRTDVQAPRFVFAHLLVPHDPFVFDARGRYVSEQLEAREDASRAYVDQLAWVNGEVLRVMDRLLAGPASSRPIVVLQSDEGPYAGEPTAWGPNPKPLTVQRKFGILNAYELPGLAPSDVPAGITPVNTFRLILDRYFGMTLPLLPDDEYTFRDLRHLYRFSRITSRVGT